MNREELILTKEYWDTYHEIDKYNETELPLKVRRRIEELRQLGVKLKAEIAELKKALSFVQHGAKNITEAGIYIRNMQKR